MNLKRVLGIGVFVVFFSLKVSSENGPLKFDEKHFSQRLSEELSFQSRYKWSVPEITINSMSENGTISLGKNKNIVVNNLSKIVFDGIMSLYRLSPELGERLLVQSIEFPNLELVLEKKSFTVRRYDSKEKEWVVRRIIKDQSARVILTEQGGQIQLNLFKFNFRAKRWKEIFMAPLFFEGRIRKNVKDLIFHEYLHTLRMNEVEKDGVIHAELGDSRFNYREHDPVYSCSSLAYPGSLMGAVFYSNSRKRFNVTKNSCKACLKNSFDGLKVSQKSLNSCHDRID